MRQRPDAPQLSLDLFFDTELPKATTVDDGSLAIEREVSRVISAGIEESGLGREEIARRMSDVLGKEVTLHMVNAYSSEARGEHNISFARAVAFDLATETYTLLKYHARKCGGRVYLGRDALLAELGKVEVLRDELNSQIKKIKQQMEGFDGRPRR